MSTEPPIGTEHHRGRDETEAEARRRLGASFKEGGERYHALRPGYPREAVDWLVGAPRQRVIEIGAGTGKLTRTLVEAGHDVVAVEPSTDMLARLRREMPTVPARRGTGESTGCATGTADVVVYGQAWHWVDPDAGSAEAVRLLRPGGVLALLWNFMDTDLDWVARLTAEMNAGEEGVMGLRDVSAEAVRPPLRREAHRSFAWVRRTSTADLAALVTTRSYYLDADAAGRDEIQARVAAVVADVHGGVDGREVSVPHVTRAHRFIAPT